MTTPLPPRERLGEGPPVTENPDGKERSPKPAVKEQSPYSTPGKLLARTRMSRRTLHRARTNRKTLTPAETILWSALRAKQLDNLKFTKQAVFDPYIADFACRSAKLIVELDGDSHAFRERQDARRTAFLEELGYRVIRFLNAQIFENLEDVLATIARAASQAPSPDPSLRGRGEDRANSPPSQGGVRGGSPGHRRQERKE